MNPNRVEGTAAAAWLIIILAGLAIATVVGAALWTFVTR